MSSRKILIADDQPLLRNMLVKVMRESGLEPIEAENGEKAIELFRTFHPAVVLSDIMMPKMDGLTLLREIKKIDMRAAVILMTGHGNEEILLKALRGGAANYFKKPFNVQEIVEVIKNLLQHQLEIDLSHLYSPFLVRERKSFIFKTVEADIFPIIHQITLQLQNIIGNAELLNAKVGIEEMLKNAIEHGNLGITTEEKHQAIARGQFGELLKQRLNSGGNADKRIFVNAEITADHFIVTIQDEGAGFDWRGLPALEPESLLRYAGRGIFLTRIYFDEVLYNQRGNGVTLIKKRKSNEVVGFEVGGQLDDTL